MVVENYFIVEYYTIMKDKVAQRERTEDIVGGARTFNEFVKEKAIANNITPACVRSLPEVKDEWKQVKAKQLAEISAEKAKTKEAKKDAKKAEKKAVQEAKKAEKKATTAVVKEKTAIKKVAKKSAVDAENIKMTLVEKAHADKPTQEPKVKGRPKKYATAEEARKAKIASTVALNKAKRALKNADKPPKAVKPQKRGKEPKEPQVSAEQIRRENEEEAKRVRKQRKAYDREMRRRGEVEQMGMEDEDASEKWNPLVYEIEMRIFSAKTGKEIDEVLKLIKKAVIPSVYDRLDPFNRKSLDHSIDVYSKKKQAMIEHQREAQKNIAMFKNAKSKKRANLEEGEIYEGRGFQSLRTDALKEFNNYGKIQDHLAHHLNTLTEAIDPKDLRDYIHFTKEKARLKSKLVGGMVRMIGGDLEVEDSDSGSDSGSDLEGGGDFFGNIKRALDTSWNAKPQTKAEKDVLNFTLNKAQPALLAPINILAPPVGKIGEAQRKLLKSKYNV